MWERFSYYGMRAILILFMTALTSTGGLGFPVVKAGAIYGFYTAMVYLLSLPGGWVADRMIGQRRAWYYMAVIFDFAAGEFFLVSPSVQLLLFPGLVLLMFGTGLLKANVSTIVGQIYGPDDIRRDSGFSIFYMGITIGALISPADLRLGGRALFVAMGIRHRGRRHARRVSSIHDGRQASGLGGFVSDAA